MVSIKPGGYTNNTGSVALNQKPAQNWANRDMGKLVTLGINKWQLEAEGYGPKHYVASNNTEAGPKPLDRRMSDEEANEFWFLVYECISQP